MKFLILIVIAIVVEGITEYLKQMIPALAKDTRILLGVTVALGVGAALTFNADLFAILGFDANVPVVGSVLTGILCARGSNYIYDLIGKLTEAKRVLTENEIEANRYLAMLNGEGGEEIRIEEDINADIVDHEIKG